MSLKQVRNEINLVGQDEHDKTLKRISENVSVEHPLWFCSPHILPQSPVLPSLLHARVSWTSGQQWTQQPVNLDNTAELMPHKLQCVSPGSH